MDRIASFHLVREPAWRAPVATARLGTDRLRLRGVPGLRFGRLLGTGRGSSTAFGADLARTALFAVWDSSAALDAFEAGPLGRRAARTVARGGEAYAVRMALVAGHGRWAGRDPLDGVARARPGGPVAVLTRAVVRPRAWHRFRAVGRAVSDEVNAAAGLLAVVAIGEAPIGLQATFSLWADPAAPTAFAFGRPEHRDVVRRTRDEGWYAEELFARFAPLSSSGTWNGHDPLRPGLEGLEGLRTKPEIHGGPD